jgi:WD40 repeat protein
MELLPRFALIVARCQRMRVQVRATARVLGLLTLCLLGVFTGRCTAADPRIFPVKLSEVDISEQIDPEPRGGGKLLPRPQLDYARLRSVAWHRSSSAALLADGADPNATSPDGEPILFQIIENDRGQGDLEDYLRAGADPNRKSRDGTTPLHTAVRQGNPRAVELLLKYGADPQAMSFGQTAIEYARARRKELVDVLEADRLPPAKPTPLQPPQVRRRPDAVFGSTLFRPACGGEALIYSTDSRQVISGDGGGALRFFEAKTGRIQNVIAAHESEVLALAAIPGSNVIVSSSGYETKFWDVSTSRELMRLQRGGRGLSVSPDGRWVFTGYHLWRIESVDPLRLSAEGRGYPQAGGDVIISWTFFTPDNRYLIFGVQNRFVYVWNLTNDYVRRVGDLKTTETESLTWGDMENMVDIGSAAPDDLLALATSQYTILTGRAATLKAFQPVVATQVRDAMSLACSPNGQYLAALGYPSRIDVYDLERRGEQIPLHGHTAALQAVAASPAGNLIASGGDDQTVRLWNRTTLEQLVQIPVDSSVYSLCFSADGTRLAIGANHSTVYMYDIGTQVLDQWHVSGRITGLTFSSEGDALVVLGDDLEVLNPMSGAKLASVSSRDAQQGTLAMTPDNVIIGSARSMAASEKFKVPCAWSFDDSQLVPRQDLFSEAMGHRTTIHAVATSPDGALLAAESDSIIRLWNLRLRQPVGNKMFGHTDHVADMEFSPDGKLLATGAWDGTARVWEIPSGRLLLVLDGDVYRVSSVAFLADGSLLTANWNGTVYLWDLPEYLGAQ